MAKRARERARQAKQAAKQAKRDAPPAEEAGLSAADEADLLEEFATLNARFQAKSISLDVFTEERTRILTELGIESE
ncbi:MAG: hypothetical protein KJN73_02605 [Acidimicrobiia bacterium]|nr:hypothetical protein [Acidimicrobiia bacterium]